MNTPIGTTLIGAFGLMAAMVSSFAQADNTYPEDMFITLKDSGQLAQYPGKQIWKGDPVMLYNSITPDGKRLVVSSPKMQKIYVFDTASHKRLGEVAVGKASKGLKVSPDGKEAYVANEGEATISVVDLASLKNVATIKVEEKPHNVRFSDDGKLAYVTLQGGAGIGVIDTATRKVTKVIKTPGIPAPHNLDLSRDGKRLFIRDVSNTVGVLNLDSGKIEKVIEVGQGHAGIDVSPDGKRVYTGAIADDHITVIDAETLKVVKKIKVGFGPHGVRTSRDGRWLYVVITSEDKMVVVDTRKLEVASTDGVAAFPFWVAVKGNP